MVLLTLLAAALIRHHAGRPAPLARKPLRSWDIPVSVLPADKQEHGHAHGIGHTGSEHRAKPAVDEAAAAVVAAPPAPVHVHPAAFEWPHTLHTKERRGPNFILNGEHAAYNEERLTPIFERARVAGLETPGLVTAFFSPGGRLKLSVLMSEEGKLGYMLDAAKPESLSGGSGSGVYLPLLAPAFMELNADFKACTWNTNNTFGAQVHWQLEYGESFWRPVPGNERRHFRETFQQAKVWCEGSQCNGCEFVWELRLYEHALAVRAVVDGASIRDRPLQPQTDPDGEYARLDFGMGVRLPVEGKKAACWAQNAEDPYETRTCTDWNEPVMTPVTVVMDPANATATPKAPVNAYRYLSILQADGPAFMRSTMQTGPEAEGAGALLHIITRGELPVHALEHQLGVIEHPVLGWSTPTSWTAVLVGTSAADLAHQASLPYLLCPPPSSAFPMAMDARWVVHGKSLRIRGHSSQTSKQLADFASTYNYQLVHFDAGWYGEENNRSSSPRVVFPEFAHELDVAAVAQYAQTRNVATTVYVNEIALKDTPELLEIYPRWGLSGIKFGFVDVSSPKAMRILHQRIIAYQHVGMAVNVHDMYRPRGLSRTWPHLVTQEGVRGEERKPDATHHTILPFVRLLQGAADYTPRYLKGALRCTQAHQLALPIVFFSPIQSLFWAEPGKAIADAVKLYLPELVVWQMIPTTWDDTRILAGEIGQYVVVARRAGTDWFVGAITNDQERTLTLNLSSLFDNTWRGAAHPLPLLDQPADNQKGYQIHMYEDDHSFEGDRSGTGSNNVKVKLRQEFILPARFSTQVSAATKAPALASQGVFPSDPAQPHQGPLSEYRRQVNEAQARQLGNMFTKQTGRGVPAPVELDSPLFQIRMAPSGGNVLYIAPIL